MVRSTVLSSLDSETVVRSTVLSSLDSETMVRSTVLSSLESETMVRSTVLSSLDSETIVRSTVVYLHPKVLLIRGLIFSIFIFHSSVGSVLYCICMTEMFLNLDNSFYVCTRGSQSCTVGGTASLFKCLLKLSQAMRKCVLCHMRTTKAQIRLHICAV